MESLIPHIAEQLTVGSTGVWALVLMGALYGMREWRETRKLSYEDRLARRDGYAKQVESLTAENRLLRSDLAKLHTIHEDYRILCHKENDQLRNMVISQDDEIEGLKRRITTMAIEMASLKGFDGQLRELGDD